MAATPLIPHLQPSACLWPWSMSCASLECQAVAQARSAARRPDPARTGRIWDARVAAFPHGECVRLRPVKTQIARIGQCSSLDVGWIVLAVEDVAAVSIVGGLLASSTTSSGKPRL
ncbi:unnamed protein product [Miscanthus lutarioriparius]|uniref:Uncharacterized protein n=1 Tax=Miscanthus lutarioriparius TaxID=422564 RepID=A0A811Q7V1_9POAL|nr:unnamed protein product [Miscanthus lutarioriparius]